MRIDPCRRFTFGFTIENVGMKLWFSDRSQILVSEIFNFVTVIYFAYESDICSNDQCPQDRIPFIHFFLAIMYAEPCDLGWDPTITPCGDGLRYNITVHSTDGTTKNYRTLKLISDSGARFIRGRGTRVWKATLVQDGEECGEPVILKDVWVDPDRRREGAILEDIRSVDRASFQDHVDLPFLTVICHGDVFLDTARTISDSTHALEHHNLAIIDAPLAPRSQSGTQSSSAVPQSLPRTASRKIHYRIILKEVCTPIDDERSVSSIFNMLAETANGVSPILIMTDFDYELIHSSSVTPDACGWMGTSRRKHG